MSDPTPEQMWGPKWHGWTWDMVTAYRKPIDWVEWYSAQMLHVLAWQKVKWLKTLPAVVKCPAIPPGAYVINKGFTHSKDTPPWLLPKPRSWNPNYEIIMGSLDPIVIDLYGNGIETVSVNQGVFFDHKGNGFAEQSGWVSPGAGLLCMDRNGNGTIDDGSELFGNETLLQNGQPAANGFQALAALDSTHDGKIDAQDAAYSQLGVWVDSDADGITQPGELFTLPQLGIDSVDLNWTVVNTTDSQGNIEDSVGSFQRADGSTGLIAEYTFQTMPHNAIPVETLPVPDDMAALPFLPGSGTVYNLQQAMVRDTSGRLEAMVKQFAAENDPNVRTALMDQILFQWTGSENIDPGRRGGSIDARKLAVLEAFLGGQWSSTVAYQGNHSDPNPGVSVMLDSLYRDISAGVYGMLMAQTHFKDLFGMIDYTIDPTTQTFTVDSNSVTAIFNELKNEAASDPVNGQQLLSEFERTILGIAELSGGGPGGGSGATAASSGGEALSAAAPRLTIGSGSAPVL